MPYKINSSLLNKTLCLCCALLSVFSTFYAQSPVVAQQVISEQKTSTEISKSSKKRIDGVAGVVGDFIVLHSDIDKALLDLKSQGVPIAEISRCEIIGSLLETKLYTHHAIQDSLPVNQKQIESQVSQQIDYMKRELGSIDKILKFYRKDNLVDFKKELYELGKSQQLASLMQEKIIEEVNVTPDEIKQFYKKIPKNERPEFGAEVEISQILIKPTPSQQEIDRITTKLNDFRSDVVDKGLSFATKAVLYSQDPGSRSNGGKYTITRNDPFAKEFKENAFRLKEGEVSKPFKTDFGYHIVTVDKIKGQTRDVRHILLIPEISSKELKDFENKIEEIRVQITSGQMTFAQAAKTYSDQSETKSDGGILINPLTLDKRFELSKMDPQLFNHIEGLNEGEVSKVIRETTRTGATHFKLLKIDKKYGKHLADFKLDYLKIKDLALKKKQLQEIKLWQDDKIKDTYIKIFEPFTSCNYTSDWLKNDIK